MWTCLCHVIACSSFAQLVSHINLLGSCDARRVVPRDDLTAAMHATVHVRNILEINNNYAPCKIVSSDVFGCRLVYSE